MRKLRNAELHRKTIEQFQHHPKLPIVVVLDNVRSMNNVGSIFRTADAFLVEKMVLCGITGTPPHREITKTAIGAEKSLTWEYQNSTLEAVKQLKMQGYVVVALEQAEGSVNLMEHPITQRPVAFVLGNEIDGVAQEVIDCCDVCVEIPQLGTKHSFNVAVSFGMLLWDYAKTNDLFNRH
jgi:23S rRNA (guanosine2251-2'-O)-methyltransferase